MSQVIEFVDRDIRTTSLNILHMFKKIEESKERHRNKRPTLNF